jgi:general secretion pathway protein L
MANTLFALDVHDDLVTGVMVDIIAKTHTVTACGMAHVGNRPLMTALSEVIAEVGYRQGPCRVSLGAEHFFFRNLQFPFSDKNKIGKILPGELAENSPLEAENMVVDFLLSRKPGGEADVLTAAAQKKYLDEQLELLRSISIDPETLGISGTHGAVGIYELAGGPERFVYLDCGFRRATLVLAVAGQITLVRSIAFDPGQQAGFQLTEDKREVSAIRPEFTATVFSSFARSVRQTILASRTGLDGRDLPLYLTGPLSVSPDLTNILKAELGIEVLVANQLSIPQVTIEEEVALRWHAGAMDRALALALSNEKSGKLFNFRKGGLKKRSSIREYRRYGKVALVPSALLLLLIVGALWHDHATIQKQRTALETQIVEVFTQTLPEVTRIVDPVQQLQVKVNEAQKVYMTSGSADTKELGVLALLAEISERIPASLQVRVVRMVADQNDARLRGTTENFNIVDSIQKELEKSPYFSKVEISSANLSSKDGGVDFELKIDLRR